MRFMIIKMGKIIYLTNLQSAGLAECPDQILCLYR